MCLNSKKTKYQALIIAVVKAKEFASLTSVCKRFNLKRDAYYKYKRRAEQRKSVEHQIIHIVNKRRKYLPREGIRKLMRSLNEDFKIIN